MPFDAFKARVKIVRDAEVVKKWIEDQSFKTEYVCLNVPEALKLPTIEEVEKHFRTVHKDTIIKSVETLSIAGVPSRNLRSRELQQLVRQEWEKQKYFPLQLATGLSRQFANHGLHFFKVNKTFTHVSVARPQFLDLETTPVSENIKRIVGHINAHPKCTRRQLVEALAPTPQPAVIEIKPATTEGAAPKAPAAAAEPTAEQTAIIADLHWLVHQGHVLEFADGRMDTAKKPLPRPQKPAKPADAKPVKEGEPAAPAAESAIETSDELPVLTEAESPTAEPQQAAETMGEAPAPAEATVPVVEAVVPAPAEATPPADQSAPAV
jgi:hypothetical protein